MFRNRVARLTVMEQAKTALFLFIGLLFLAGIYFGTWRLMAYLNGVAVVGALLVNKLMAMVFLTSFTMVVFSALITSFTTIFSSRDLQWLMATPVPARTLFSYKALSTAAYASWMVLVALVPFVIAVGQVKGAALSFYAGTAVLLVPFLVLASLCGILASLVLMRFVPSHRGRDILLLLGVLMVTGLYILFRLLQPERFVKPDGMEVVAQYLSYLDAPTAVYLPSWWLTGGVYSLLSGVTRDMVFYASLLFGGAAAGGILVVACAQRFFYIGWAEGRVHRHRGAPIPASCRARKPATALLCKDGTVFFRDTNQWSQLLLLSALVIVYLFSIHKLPLETVYLQNLVSFFNVGLVGFVLAAVALRFVFPAISLEGESMWLLKASPLSMRKLLAEKLVFGSIPVVAMGLFLIVASSWLLKADWPVFLISLAAVAIMAVGLSCMAVGFGAMFPVYNYTSVAQIESSAGGLFYIVAAFFYLGINIGLWAWPVQTYYQHKFGGAHIPWMYFGWTAVALAAVNGAASLVPLWRGCKSLEELER